MKTQNLKIVLKKLVLPLMAMVLIIHCTSCVEHLDSSKATANSAEE